MRCRKSFAWFAGALCALAPALAAEFQAGVARVNITPPVPYWLSGYASRTNPATAVRHELFAKALALADDRGGKAVIVTADIIGFSRELSDSIAERVAKQHGLQRSQLLFNFSHTHYGPVVGSNLSTMYTFSDAEKENVARYTSKLADNVVALIGA
ncbi:MAG: neutral/alkaline non-lysosomal ceramidase N-terminal domain-containing protein, partial [Kiritimatiellaeota bacterium]|nr:neutral/alkaline non-lysosomal ceramidase N-terminal domain-containing protein [Kiritimatiellota bacterium]